MPYFLFGNWLATHELFKFLNVLITVECETMSFAAIPPGATGFLIITLNGFWNIIMDHKAHIGLVYAHSKGNGRYHHIGVFHKEHVLVLYSGFPIKPCMIRNSLDSIYL